MLVYTNKKLILKCHDLKKYICRHININLNILLMFKKIIKQQSI